MSSAVRVERRADAYLQRLELRVQARIVRRLRQIAEDPYGIHSKPLTDPHGRRAARVGDWRIIFSVDTASRVVIVSDISPRGGAYRNL